MRLRWTRATQKPSRYSPDGGLGTGLGRRGRYHTVRGMCALTYGSTDRGSGVLVTTTNPSSLRRLDGIRPLYVLPADPFAEEVLIPCLSECNNCRLYGRVFSSAVLASLAPGLATYISATQHSFRLIVSPMLSAQDQEAIRRGLKSPAEVADSHLADITITEDLLQRHTLECLSWLLRNGRLEVKVALMTDALFHPKVGCLLAMRTFSSPMGQAT